MIKFLEYLYNKYYYFQVKVGNGIIAAYTSMLFLVFVLIIYVLSLFMFIPSGFFDPVLIITMDHVPWISMGLFFLLMIINYRILIYKKKYKRIIKDQKYIKKSSLLAILFPIVAFILFNVGCILKVIQNNR